MLEPTTVDWIALAAVLVAAFGGWRRGLVLSALSLLGLVAGAYAGSRVAPHLLSGGALSRWTPLASLGGAVAGATLLQTLATAAGSVVRGGLRLTPLRFVDSVAGLAFGAATGLVLVWVVAATALLLPGQTELRRAVQASAIVQRLNEAVPPRRLLNLLARIDPFPSIAGPAAPELPPDASVLRDPVVRRAAASVVKVLGTACGIGIEGSGWYVRPNLVVTNAHVVAGEDDTHVGGERAVVVAFDARNDIAVLLVAERRRPLPIADAQNGAAVAIVGFPENGPLTSTPGRVGRTATVLTQDAYGRGPVSRTVTALGGSVRHGNSGGPAIDRRGRVQATVFAARINSSGGFGVPRALVERALASAGQRGVSTGDCAAG